MSQPTRMLIALVAGIAAGMGAAAMGWNHVAGIAGPIGNLWLDMLQMTIIPLVTALLINGIVQAADTARGGALAVKSVLLFVGLLWASTLIAAFLVPALLKLWPLADSARAALSSALGNKQHLAAVGKTPDFADFLGSMFPSNPIAAAASDAMLPLILFTLLFALAASRLEPGAREPIARFFGAIEQAMLVLVGWVLVIAPIGIFALALTLGVNAGLAAVGALAHYILIVCCAGLVGLIAAYPVAVFAGRVGLFAFARAVAPAQAFALSTQSSLASLPAMLKSCARLGFPEALAGVPLPIAVAMFRVTSPAMNLGVALYVAHWTGVEVGPAQIAMAAVVAGLTTFATVSLPGTLTFFTSVTPVAVALGVPLEPLALLVAVEMIPDLMRTVGNVTMDVAATGALVRHHDAEIREAA